MNAWVLPCGCEVTWEPVGIRMSFVVTKRCDEHPTGDIPVASMVLMEPSAAVPESSE